MPYNTTELERDIALVLGIPMYGADPRLVDLGTKTGCRRLFGEEDVSYPIGVEDLHSIDEVVVRDRLDAHPAAGVARGHRQAERGCLRRRQCPR